MGAWMPDCREVTEMVSRSLDDPMTFSQRMRMWMHLAMCRYCARFKRQLQFLREAVKGARVPPEFGPDRPGLSPEARQRIKLALQEGAVK